MDYGNTALVKLLVFVACAHAAFTTWRYVRNGSNQHKRRTRAAQCIIFLVTAIIYALGAFGWLDVDRITNNELRLLFIIFVVLTDTNVTTDLYGKS